VASRNEGLDPVGATVGQRGGRVQAVVAELGGEKIDIIPWNEDPAAFVANALSPAQVVNVTIDEENRIASVTVPERMLSLAIGREGQNARLAAKLTGWRIDIRSDQAAQARPAPAAPADGEVVAEEVPAEGAEAPAEAAEAPAEAAEAPAEAAEAPAKPTRKPRKKAIPVVADAAGAEMPVADEAAKVPTETTAAEVAEPAVDGTKPARRTTRKAAAAPVEAEPVAAAAPARRSRKTAAVATAEEAE
jgi:transcription antitermination factor NusA-like protein